MDLSITRADVDKFRRYLREHEPLKDEDFTFDGPEDEDYFAGRRARFAKDILEHFGLSLTDPNDYGDIPE